MTAADTTPPAVRVIVAELEIPRIVREPALAVTEPPATIDTPDAVVIVAELARPAIISVPALAVIEPPAINDVVAHTPAAAVTTAVEYIPTVEVMIADEVKPANVVALETAKPAVVIVVVEYIPTFDVMVAVEYKPADAPEVVIDAVV